MTEGEDSPVPEPSTLDGQFYLRVSTLLYSFRLMSNVAELASQHDADPSIEQAITKTLDRYGDGTFSKEDLRVVGRGAAASKAAASSAIEPGSLRIPPDVSLEEFWADMPPLGRCRYAGDAGALPQRAARSRAGWRHKLSSDGHVRISLGHPANRRRSARWGALGGVRDSRASSCTGRKDC